MVGAGSLSGMIKLAGMSGGCFGVGMCDGCACSRLAQRLCRTATASGIDAAAAEVLKSTGVPSASVAVVQGGKVAYVKAYGMARLDPPMAAEPGMQYSIGSISKQFTATMVLLLMQDGKLKTGRSGGQVSAGADAGE